MRLALTVLGLAALAATAAAQDMPPRMPLPADPYATQYGAPQPADLSDLMLTGNSHHAVVVRGDIAFLDPQSRYFLLQDGAMSVVLIPVGEIGSSVRDLMGRHVEVVGLARELVAKQDTCQIPGGRSVPQSYCDDPDLPPTPDLTADRVGWPRMSITAWSISDAAGFGTQRRSLELSSLAALLAGTPTPNKDIRVAGRFCGANLCGGMGPPPEVAAWAIEEDGTAVWVVGKEPKGNGWQLDPAYKGDTARWLEVVGRLQPCGRTRTRCLRARTVTLVPRPAAASP